MTAPPTFWTPQAWLPGGWAHNVRLTVAPDGTWQQIEAGIARAQASASSGPVTCLDSPVLPGVVNTHSHAFQRAIAGLTERSGGQHDDFWSWRDRMYRAALRITPAQLEAIATQLYAELLQGGYTHVCEFHYLHNDLDGQPYANPLEMSLALVRAAQAAGIGLTLLPALYMRSGFGTTGLRDDQRRFASTPASVLEICEAVNRLKVPHVNAGVALHSLRAVDAGALAEVAQTSCRAGWPVHIHISEQLQEVDACVALHGQRPIERLLNLVSLDGHWNLVHATHTSSAELRALQTAGASVVLCPSTEANLGDGIFDFPAWADLQGSWSLGSDSHVTRRWTEELRLLEYSQRLALRQRNVAARATGMDSTAASLLQSSVRGGSAAAGIGLAGLVVGQRADFCLLDTDDPPMWGIPDDHRLDALVFSSPDASLHSAHVAGRAVPALASQWRASFKQAMRVLWG